MEQKRELSLTSSGEQSGEHSYVMENQPMFDFEKVPADDIKKEIHGHLASTMQNSLALTSKSHFSLFKPNFKSELTTKLLVCVAWGQQDEVEKLLKTSPELMLEKTTFTDCSGRLFSNISAFEFLLWALDTRYMVNMMFNCLPENGIGLDLVEQLKEQYYRHQAHGVTYILDHKKINEKHFDFSVLIDALQAYIDSFHNDSSELELQRVNHWNNVVGRAQCYLPMHIIQHYCEPEGAFCNFFPKFEAEQFNRTLKFYDCALKKEMIWSGITPSSDSDLGVPFSIMRGYGSISACKPFQLAFLLCNGSHDLAALKNLWEVRTLDYLAIPSKLASLFEEKVAIDEIPNGCVIL